MPTIANITLAHAHRVQEDRHQFYDAYKEPPVTPPRKRRKVERTPRGGSSGGSTSGRSSALIRELDTTEREFIIALPLKDIPNFAAPAMFMRAEINRLLSRPDFAGLNNYEDNTRRQSGSPYDDMSDEDSQAIDQVRGRLACFFMSLINYLGLFCEISLFPTTGDYKHTS